MERWGCQTRWRSVRVPREKLLDGAAGNHARNFVRAAGNSGRNLVRAARGSARDLVKAAQEQQTRLA